MAEETTPLEPEIEEIRLRLYDLQRDGLSDEDKERLLAVMSGIMDGTEKAVAQRILRERAQEQKNRAQSQ